MCQVFRILYLLSHLVFLMTLWGVWQDPFLSIDVPSVLLGARPATPLACLVSGAV